MKEDAYFLRINGIFSKNLKLKCIRWYIWGADPLRQYLTVKEIAREVGLICRFKWQYYLFESHEFDISSEYTCRVHIP